MILTEQGVIHYLLYRGLIGGEDALCDKTILKKSSSRNRNFLLSLKNNQGFFIKQSSSFLSEKTETLRSEANLYWLANNDPAFAILLPVLCKYYDYNPQYNILILESISKGKDVFEIMQKNKTVDQKIATEMARALSLIHHITLPALKNARSENLFSKFIPWIFRIEKDKSNPFYTGTAAAKEIIDIVNKHSNFITLVIENKEAWEIKSLIHGDIKFPNFFVKESENGDTFKVIDFEICDLGDPCWDAAGVFQSFLTWWADAAGATDESLTFIQPAVKLFWEIYSNEMADLYADEFAFRMKCMKYAAIRMIQTCYEMSSGQELLFPNQIKILQMSLNILTEPQQACTDLFDIN